MATLLQLMRPWIQHAIAESEARMEQRTKHMMDHKVQAVHKRLYAFESIVLQRLAPTDDVTTLRKEVESLCADIIGLLVPPETEPEFTPTAPIDNMVVDALFGDEMLLPISSRHAGKRPCSSQTSDDIEAWRAHKRKH
ncbi:hypothetical protein R3W88_026661 [Solanum pinnatisectum]|uniref:Integrase core domain containing protein n=1 Tax=Solanum pinnatisectum TaxID=50273 RepID=A0AAV9LHM5_9SOLN|nr:hypothetical protein R3W88_026661 [Solanum pinnatisectum]